MERGAAFNYLYRHRKVKSYVANASLISVALDKHIPSYDINEDGRKWYMVEDLNNFLQKGPPVPASAIGVPSL